LADCAKKARIDGKGENNLPEINPFAIFNQPLICPQMTQIIADMTEEMASNLCKSVKLS